MSTHKKIIGLLFLVIACQKKNVSDNAIQLPYPSLENQRAVLATKPIVTPVRILDSLQIVNDLKYLSSSECAGRKPSTNGHNKAFNYILRRMRESGIDSMDNSFVQVFRASEIQGSTAGVNIFGYVRGTEKPNDYVVLTAHYDHLGQKNNETYFGADDNASGVACLLGLAKYFKQNPGKLSIIFVATDREENFLEGAYNIVELFRTRQMLSKISINMNMDMISRNDNNEIFACGIYHYPQFKYIVDSVQSKTNVKLLMGHDTRGFRDDWTGLSDHSAFHQRKIPFIYFGVEDHADYHAPTDTFEKINLSFYIEICNMIAQAIKAIKTG